MPYPDKILADDEQVVEHLHPHWITLVPATLWFFALCAGAGIALGYAPSHGTVHSAFVLVILALALTLFVSRTFGPWLAWRTTHYVFTTHRVLIRRGVMRQVGRDIALQRINDVGYSQSLWDRIVQAGSLSIESAGEHGQEDLHDIPRSNQMQQTLNRLIEQDSERRARLAYGGQSRYPQFGAGTEAYPSTGYLPQTYPGEGGYPTDPHPTRPYPPR